MFHAAKQQLDNFRIQINCNLMILSFDTYLGIGEGARLIVLTSEELVFLPHLM